MSFIFCALIYVFIDSRMIVPIKTLPLPKTKPTEVEKVSEGVEVIELNGENTSEVPPKRIKRLDSDEGDRSPDSQKLVFFPSRTLKPPKIQERPRVIHFPQIPSNHRLSSRMSEPRPFKHMTGGAKPIGFQVTPMSTARSFQIDNIREVMRQNQLPSHQTTQGMVASVPMHYTAVESSTRPVQLAGTYRHPRKNGELSQLFGAYDQSKFSTSMPDMIPDPFHNYKANSPYEINQLALNGMRPPYSSPIPSQSPYFRRKFRHQVASIPHYNLQANDAASIYQNVLHSGKKFQDRNEDQRKPLSMMLDMFSMPDDMEMQAQLQMPHMHHPPPPRMTRMKPFQGYYQDPNLFNAMLFPQLMPRYHHPYFRYPKHPKHPSRPPPHGQHPHPQQHHQMMQQHIQPIAEASSNQQIGLKTTPSQLVVHLNLYPKNKGSFKRSSSEDHQVEVKKKIVERYPQRYPERHTEVYPEKPAYEKADKSKNNTETSTAPVNINFNLNTGNGHPENIQHQVFQSSMNPTKESASDSSTEPGYRPSIGPSYYYDDSEDESIMMAPSIPYHNIHRDRPIHLMLKNTNRASSGRQKKKSKNTPKNHKQTYETIERPKKHKIKNDLRNYANIFQ